jgi:hypothetical protein
MTEDQLQAVNQEMLKGRLDKPLFENIRGKVVDPAADRQLAMVAKAMGQYLLAYIRADRSARKTTGCFDCTFYAHLYADETVCTFADRKIESPGDETPDWCPLRKGPITVMLEEESHGRDDQHDK